MRRKSIKAETTRVRTLEWVPSKRTKRAYHLQSGEQVVGTIRWPKFLGSLAEADFGERSWTFKRAGFLRPRVSVREKSSDTDLAILELSWSSNGQLKMSDGARYRWERQGFWSQTYVFKNENGLELVRVEPKFGLTRRTGKVEIINELVHEPDLWLMMALGWYVIMLIADDEAATLVICCS